MKKIILSIVIIIGLNFSVKAQDKFTIGILPFTYSGSTVKNSQDVFSIQEAVVNGFVNTKRFIILDRTKTQDLKKEREAQKTEDFIDSKVLVEQGKSLGAAFIVAGHVVSVSVEENIAEDERGRKYVSGYTARIAFSLKLINVETGEVKEAETIQVRTADGTSLFGSLVGGSSGGTPQDATGTAIKGIDKKIDKFVAKNFPVEFFIAEIQEKDGKGNAKKVLIAGGSAFGVNKGDELKVVEIVETTVNGQVMKRRKEIGRIKVTKVEDENFSICEVKDGGIEINSRFTANAKLQVITKD